MNRSLSLRRITCIGDLCGIVDDFVHNLLHFTTLQDPYSNTLVVACHDSATVSFITVCEESTMPVTVYVEVLSTGDRTNLFALPQASIPEEGISTYVG